MKLITDLKGKVKFYEESDDITRTVCKNQCSRWKLIKEIDRSKRFTPNAVSLAGVKQSKDCRCQDIKKG